MISDELVSSMWTAITVFNQFKCNINRITWNLDIVLSIHLQCTQILIIIYIADSFKIVFTNTFLFIFQFLFLFKLVVLLSKFSMKWFDTNNRIHFNSSNWILVITFLLLYYFFYPYFFRLYIPKSSNSQNILKYLFKTKNLIYALILVAK